MRESMNQHYSSQNICIIPMSRTVTPGRGMPPATDPTRVERIKLLKTFIFLQPQLELL
jgi:hypothetical protein